MFVPLLLSKSAIWPMATGSFEALLTAGMLWPR